MKKEYVILDDKGNYLATPNETGSGLYIAVFSRDEATLEIDIFYRFKGYKIKKIKIK